MDKKEIKLMRVQIPCNSARQIIGINVKSHHRHRGKWKINEWYDWYKKFPYKEKIIKIID